MPIHRHRPKAVQVTGRTMRDDPVKPVRRKVVQIDEDALAEAKATLAAAEAEERARRRLRIVEPPEEEEAPVIPIMKPPRSTPRVATGTCHTCGRAVSGERRFCGTCLAKRL